MPRNNLPNFHYERKLFKNGFSIVAGLDEVGRGSLAGPIVVGATVFDKETSDKFFKLNKLDKKIVINDSKKLTELQRIRANKFIRKNVLAFGVGTVSARKINKIGIVKATEMAYRKAIISANSKTEKRVEYLLIDAFYIPYLSNYPSFIRSTKNKKTCGKYLAGTHRQLPIIKGDEKSVSIAAASIVAKVYRDNYMTKKSKIAKYRKYCWDKNKGYGTSAHRVALLKYGKTIYHRNLFLRKLFDNFKK